MGDGMEYESLKTISYRGLEGSSANWMQQREHQEMDGHMPSHPDPVSGVVPILWDAVQPSINDVLKVICTSKW